MTRRMNHLPLQSEHLECLGVFEEDIRVQSQILAGKGLWLPAQLGAEVRSPSFRAERFSRRS